MNQKYKDIYLKSIQNREVFWKEISENVFWYKKPTKILNSEKPPFYKWFEDGVTNTCYNALDLHIDKGRGDKLAIIYDSPITGVKKKITYNGHRSSTVIYARKEIKINKRKKIFLKKFCHSKLFSELPKLGDIIKVDEPICLLHLKSKNRICLNKKIEKIQSNFLKKIEEV